MKLSNLFSKFRGRVLILILLVSVSIKPIYGQILQHSIDFRLGRLASGYQDLKMNMYGLGYQVKLWKRFSLNVSYNHSSGELRNYYGVFIGYQDSDFTPDNFSGHVLFRPQNFSESEVWDDFYETGNIGYGKNIPSSLLANIHNVKLGVEYRLFNFGKSRISAHLAGSYVYQRMAYEQVAGNWVIVNPIKDIPGEKETIKAFLKLHTYERQSILGISFGVNYWYDVTEKFQLGFTTDVANLRILSSFSSIQVVGRCYL